MVVGLLIFGDMWRYGCPKSSMWEREEEAWSEDENVSSSVARENNVCNGALHVIGLCGPGDKVSLSSWKIGSLRGWHIVVTWPWTCYCQEMNEALVVGLLLPKGPFVTAGEALLSPSTGCDKKRRGMW